jgi:hypothetical protein
MNEVIYYKDFYNKLVMEYNNSEYLDEEEHDYVVQLIHKLEEWYIKDEDNRRKGMYSKKRLKKERKEDIEI